MYKIPIPRALNDFSARKIAEALQQGGKTLPATVQSYDGKQTVIVSFDVVSGFTLPHVQCQVAMSNYIRLPLRKGDKGICLPSDAFISSLAGNAPGAANLTNPANLSALTFLPISAKAFSDEDPEKVVIVCDKGATIKTSDGQYSAEVSPGSAELKAPGANVKVSDGRVDLNGTLYINGAPYLAHKHKSVKTGNDESGGVA